MFRRTQKWLLASLVLLGLVLVPVTVLAHESETVGDYVVEYGWLYEPAVVGQPNAIVINISKDEEPVDIGPASLRVEVVFGPASKTLALQPLAEDSHGEYIARLTPTRMGLYTVHLAGTIEDQPVDLELQPEEIIGAETVEFPPLEAADSNTPFGLQGWLAVVALAFGIAGAGLGLAAMIRR